MDNKILGPIVLLTIDGWGVSLAGDGNALSKADTPFFKELISKYPTATILTTEKRKIKLSHNYLALGFSQPHPDKKSLGLLDVLSASNNKWLIITEAEKYASAIYFFNNQKAISNDNFISVKSGLVEKYDLDPAMATVKVTAEITKALKRHDLKFILATLDCLDSVSHTGNFSATIMAAEAVDKALKKITKEVLASNGVLIVTAVAGKAEEMVDMKTEIINKKSTANPVPVIIVGQEFEGKTIGLGEVLDSDITILKPSGKIVDIAPTILKLLNLEAPTEMIGKSLI